ncbi:MAG: hypothetical protein WC220_04760 [Pedobacter sp.]|jgi:hypothetical protein
MKLIAVYRTIILFTLTGIFPAMLYAWDKEIDGKPLRKISVLETSAVFVDSIPVRRAGDKKEQDRPAADIRPGENRPGENRPDDIRRIQEISGENQRIRQKSGIKQVPRSIPKLKPKAVTDRIPIRRPPMRIPKKGFGGIHF